MNRTQSKRVKNNVFKPREIEWELRPGGMLVQKREQVRVDDSDPLGSSTIIIRIKVSHASHHYSVSIPAHSTFGDLKKVIADEIGLKPEEQRLIFTGKEKEDGEFLHLAGVKDMSKVILMEDPASKERKLAEIKSNQTIFLAYQAVTDLRLHIDKIAQKITSVENAMLSGAKIQENEVAFFKERLLLILLKLDCINATGEAKLQRRIEVRRVQTLLEKIDYIKVWNRNPFITIASPSKTKKKNKFGSGIGNPAASLSNSHSTSSIPYNWEMFD